MTTALTNEQLNNKIDVLEARLERLISTGTADVQGNVDKLAVDSDLGWLVLCGALVFFMQAGFGVLEAGAISRKNVVNILFKNILDASGAAIMFWLVGYGFAFGETAGGVIGKTNFALTEIYNGAGGPGGKDGWASFFFQWAFAGAAATIVAGSVAERCKISAYFIYSIFISAFIYPVVVHWVWGTGWLSAWGARPDENGNARPIFRYNSESNGMIDFAGSGVVHAVGGWSGLMGALALGPRTGRFDPITGAVNPMPAHNAALMSLGTLILWFGWYGFNCGSTLAISGFGNLAAKVAVNTTLSAASGCIVGCFTTKLFEGHYDLGLTLNSILAGLVGVTASCCLVNPWMAVVIGASSALWYYLAHHLILKLKIDDPLDAFPLHGICGIWGCLCVGIFCTDNAVRYAGYPNVNNACGRGEQFGVQIVGCLAIIGWVVVNTGVLFFVLKHTIGMRVTLEEEHVGMDVSEHGGGGFDDPAPIVHTQYYPEPVKYSLEPPPPAPAQAAPVLYMEQPSYGGGSSRGSPPAQISPQQNTQAYLPPADPYGYQPQPNLAPIQTQPPTQVYGSPYPAASYSNSQTGTGYYPQTQAQNQPYYAPQVGLQGSA